MHGLEREAESTNTTALSTTDLIFMRRTHLRSSLKCLKLRNFNIRATRWKEKSRRAPLGKVHSFYLQLAVFMLVCSDTFDPAYHEKHLSFSSYFR